MKFNSRMCVLFVFVLSAHLSGCTTPNVQSEKLSAAYPVLTGHAFVYDGDSIFIGKVEVRLTAIDAPERDQACRDPQANFWPCGIVARDALRKRVGDNAVRCLIEGRDQYKRLLGTCFTDGEDLNRMMVEKGYAIAYRHFSEKYALAEDDAKQEKLGIWQDAAFTEPYYCRHFAAGHTCYEYDYESGTGRVAQTPLIGKSHANNVTN